jgi:hypothetical protein
MRRTEAVGLLKELAAEQLIEPSLVLIRERSIDCYQLQIKGNYDFQEIEMFVKNRFSLEENKGFLIFTSHKEKGLSLQRSA